jgi:hypothetical protein
MRPLARKGRRPLESKDLSGRERDRIAKRSGIPATGKIKYYDLHELPRQRRSCKLAERLPGCSSSLWSFPSIAAVKQDSQELVSKVETPGF